MYPLPLNTLELDHTSTGIHLKNKNKSNKKDDSILSYLTSFIDTITPNVIKSYLPTSMTTKNNTNNNKPLTITPLPSRITGQFIGPGVWIYDKPDQLTLWQRGFFGKGILSRSDPSWETRTRTRLLEDTPLSAIPGGLSEKRDLGTGSIEMLHAWAEEFMSDSQKNNDNQVENSDELDKWAFLKDMEYLQLTPYETIFLTFAIDALIVKNHDQTIMSIDELWKTFQSFHSNAFLTLPLPTQQQEQQLPDINDFIPKYVCYHYYRAKGWVVREGMKYGTDFLLYKSGGPVFHHADLGILIYPFIRSSTCSEPWSDERAWGWIAGKLRVCGQARKKLSIAFVELPEFLLNSDNENIQRWMDRPDCIRDCRVWEVAMSRWIPQRTRD